MRVYSIIKINLSFAKNILTDDGFNNIQDLTILLIWINYYRKKKMEVIDTVKMEDRPIEEEKVRISVRYRWFMMA